MGRKTLGRQNRSLPRWGPGIIGGSGRNFALRMGIAPPNNRNRGNGQVRKCVFVFRRRKVCGRIWTTVRYWVDLRNPKGGINSSYSNRKCGGSNSISDKGAA